jgi:GNAT superfamily N-acetyltransferase
MLQGLRIRQMERADWAEVAELICASTNTWYQRSGKPRIFESGSATLLFCEVYEALDPGCCVVAEDPVAKRLAGSCFYHPRQTHWSLGIMNTHPEYFGRGVARDLLKFITDQADAAGLPVRLVSSAMNLDSFSLYTRAGFVPRRAFQDMFVDVPREGLRVASSARIRPAALEDVPAMAELEMEIALIRRENDYRFFINNAQQIWHTSVLENEQGGLDGFLTSVNHPGCNMLGPGVARTEDDAFQLILGELNHHKGPRPVFLVPCDCPQLVGRLYAIGARNCELHFAQVRGRFEGFNGVVMPTFMPETG